MEYNIALVWREVRKILNTIVGIQTTLGNLISGGGGGSGSNTIGSGEPSAPPSNITIVTIYVDRDTGKLWYWDPANSTWN